MNLDFTPLIAKRRTRFDELEKAITDPSLFDDAKKAREVLKEHSRVKELLTTWDDLENSRRQLDENEELAKGSDTEMAELAKAHELYLRMDLGARDDAAAMQYLIPNWKFDPKRPALVR